MFSMWRSLGSQIFIPRHIETEFLGELASDVAFADGTWDEIETWSQTGEDAIFCNNLGTQLIGSPGHK